MDVEEVAFNAAGAAARRGLIMTSLLLASRQNAAHVGATARSGAVSGTQRGRAELLRGVLQALNFKLLKMPSDIFRAFTQAGINMEQVSSRSRTLLYMDPTN